MGRNRYNCLNILYTYHISLRILSLDFNQAHQAEPVSCGSPALWPCWEILLGEALNLGQIILHVEHVLKVSGEPALQSSTIFLQKKMVI